MITDREYILSKEQLRIPRLQVDSYDECTMRALSKL